jgi:hypothetical protein
MRWDTTKGSDGRRFVKDPCTHIAIIHARALDASNRPIPLKNSICERVFEDVLLMS